jgi:hypothetical protein
MITMICLIETHRALVIVSFPVTVISSNTAFASALNESFSAGNKNDEKFYQDAQSDFCPVKPQLGNDNMRCFINFKTHRAFMKFSFSVRGWSISVLIMAVASTLNESLSVKKF